MTWPMVSHGVPNAPCPPCGSMHLPSVSGQRERNTSSFSILVLPISSCSSTCANSAADGIRPARCANARLSAIVRSPRNASTVPRYDRTNAASPSSLTRSWSDSLGEGFFGRRLRPHWSRIFLTRARKMPVGWRSPRSHRANVEGSTRSTSANSACDWPLPCRRLTRADPMPSVAGRGS
jgi:hypothetical protein